MKIRFATSCDSKKIADLYFECNQENPDSFMCRLGRGFLRAYYSTTLRHGNSVVLCACDEQGEIIGFAAGTTDIAATMKAVRRARLRLVFAAAGRWLRDPRLLRQMALRSRSTENYIVAEGARWEYWAWSPRFGGSNGAVRLHRSWRAVMGAIGIERVRLEVNAEDERIAQMHLALGAYLVEEKVVGLGRRRLILEFRLQT